jgi:hypothetical protein
MGRERKKEKKKKENRCRMWRLRGLIAFRRGILFEDSSFFSSLRGGYLDLREGG